MANGRAARAAVSRTVSVGADDDAAGGAGVAAGAGARLVVGAEDVGAGVMMGGGGGAAASPVRAIGAFEFVGRVVSGISPKDLKGLVDEAKKTITSGAVAIVGLTDDGKAGIVVGVTADATGVINAVDMVRIGSEIMGGKGGGGRPDMAQAGGPDGTHADAAIEAVAARIEALAGA